MKCLFCEFQGTKDELIAHSGKCEGHPLWAELQTKKLTLMGWLVANGPGEWIDNMRNDLAAARAQVAKLSGELEGAQRDSARVTQVLSKYNKPLRKGAHCLWCTGYQYGGTKCSPDCPRALACKILAQEAASEDHGDATEPD